MTSSALPNIDTVPRDPSFLSNQTIFIHRKLADALNEAGCTGFGSQKERSAFIASDKTARVQALLDGLHEYDAKRGGTPPAATVAATPAAAAPVRAPVAEAAPEAEAPKRQPKTAAANGVASTGAPAAATEIVTLIGEIRNGDAKIQEGIAALKGDFNGELDALVKAIESQHKKYTVTLGIVALIAEEILGPDYLDLALARAAEIEEKLGKG